MECAIRKKIGEVLKEAGLITEEQLQKAIVSQKGRNKRLGKVLIELGFVNDIQIAEALARQLNIPLVACEDCTITREVLDLVLRDVAVKTLLMPYKQEGNKLFIAMADPLDWATIDDLRFRTGFEISVAVAPETQLVNAIEKHYGSEDIAWDLLKEMPTFTSAEFVKEVEADEQNINIQSLKLSEAPPVIKLVTMILVNAVKERASDVHIEPSETLVQVRYRVDGDMRNALNFPKHIQDSVISRIKIISNLDITNRRLPQDGRSVLRLSGRVVDLRISTLPSIHGENIVIRLLERSTGLVPLGQLGIPDHVLGRMKEIFSHPQGMLIVTGPTGSGKSTTLYAGLQELRTEKRTIMTIEDPVEYQLEGITQVAVNEAIGLTFTAALRSILRQDPNIIMVGEIRDAETAQIAIRSAMTGHLVLSTLHTNDTVAAISRLVDIGVEPFLLASAISGIFAQRLVKRICPACKADAVHSAEAERSGLPQLKTVYKGAGCSKCNQTGYRGRVGVYEFLLMNAKIKRLVTEKATEDELWAAAREAGIITLFEDAWGKVSEGITTVEEVIAKVPYNRFILSPEIPPLPRPHPNPPLKMEGTEKFPLPQGFVPGTVEI